MFRIGNACVRQNHIKNVYITKLYIVWYYRNMTVKEKLNLILKFSGLTQTQLAGHLGVTFAAFNRWTRGRAVPRKRAQIKIDISLLEDLVCDAILEGYKILER